MGIRELTVCAYPSLKIPNLGERRVLSTCAEEVAESCAVNAAVSALVEELEGFAVVGGGLGHVIHCCSFAFVYCAESRLWLRRREGGSGGMRT
jgi:hypothetical protein